jgi:hypothetical protein
MMSEDNIDRLFNIFIAFLLATMAGIAFLMLIFVILFVGSIVFSPNAEDMKKNAENNAANFCSQLAIQSDSLFCATVDSDQNRYVDCTIAMGGELLPIECEYTENGGCQMIYLNNVSKQK